MPQGSELIIILLVALVVIGPARLPELARRAGRWSAELRRAANELRRGLEAEVGDLKSVKDEFQAPLKEVNQAMADTRNIARKATKPLDWVGPTPQRGPTADDSSQDLASIDAGETPSEPTMDTETGAGGGPDDDKRS